MCERCFKNFKDDLIKEAEDTKRQETFLLCQAGSSVSLMLPNDAVVGNRDDSKKPTNVQNSDAPEIPLSSTLSGASSSMTNGPNPFDDIDAAAALNGVRNGLTYTITLEVMFPLLPPVGQKLALLRFAPAPPQTGRAAKKLMAHLYVGSKGRIGGPDIAKVEALEEEGTKQGTDKTRTDQGRNQGKRLQVGSRVRARYRAPRGREYYDGKIDIVNRDGTYAIHYDDGDREGYPKGHKYYSKSLPGVLPSNIMFNGKILSDVDKKEGKKKTAGPEKASAASQNSDKAANKTKNEFGEQLYPLIVNGLEARGKKDTLAGKVTGMLLELDNSEISHLLESPGSLDEKLTEALDVLTEAFGSPDEKHKDAKEEEDG